MATTIGAPSRPDPQQHEVSEVRSQFAARQRHRRPRVAICTTQLAGLLVAFAILAPQAFAQKTAKVTFKGGLLNSLVGACATSVYNTICPSGACRCEVYFIDPDTKKDKATGTLIGKAPGSEIDITFDGGSDFVGTGPGLCQPFFASAFLPGDKDNQQLDFTGTECSPLKANSGQDPLSGGFGIASSDNGHTGFGTLTGTINENTGAISLKFSGPAN
jgi:hypothetical protein